MESSDVSCNAATGPFARGGGIFVSSAWAQIYDSSIDGNSAGVDGGGIYAADRALFVSGGEVDGNTAGGYGGGVYIDFTGPATNGVLWCVSVTNNQAGGKGGGFYIKSGSFRFDQPVAFSDNKAKLGLDGGGYSPPPQTSVTVLGLPVGAQTVDVDQ